MITNFRNDKITEYMKAKFIEAFRDEDYEKAIDYLLKYSEFTDYPQFHLAMGVLYNMMTQDSDDVDLCYLAYREFLMHIRRFPKCEAAYRGLLAAEYLRHDYPDVEEYRRWFSKRGMNVTEIFKALSKAGLVFQMPDDPIDLYELLLPGELGALDPLQPNAQDKDAQPQSERKSKIIRFDGGVKNTVNAERVEKPSSKNNKIVSFDDIDDKDDETFSIAFDGEEELDDETRTMLDDFIQFVTRNEPADGESYEESKSVDDTILDLIESEADDTRYDIIRLASEKYDKRDYEGALNILSRVSAKDPQYYFALTLRGVVLLERAEGDDMAQALNVLHEALELKPGGALASTLLCQAYENSGKYNLIPGVLKEIDNADFVNSAHVFKAFELAHEYCTPSDAMRLTEQYIDEYNLMDMRLIYALMSYNNGDREQATKELYALSRVNYDDLHFNFFYLLAKTGTADKLPVDLEAPQEVLAAIVERIMSAIEDSDVPNDILVDSDLFTSGLEFFFTLEFKNSKKTLIRMFDTLAKIAANPVFDERARDALVSPYAEPIVKGVILAELFSRDNNTSFLLHVNNKHYSDDTVETIGAGYSDGVYRAYGMLLALCPSAAQNVTYISDKLAAVKDALELRERDIQYYIVKRTLKDRGISLDYRLAYATGFRAKSEADRIYSAIDKKL